MKRGLLGYGKRAMDAPHITEEAHRSSGGIAVRRADDWSVDRIAAERDDRGLRAQRADDRVRVNALVKRVSTLLARGSGS
jgi:hypothetical protein